jgi:hypothetical protein
MNRFLLLAGGLLLATGAQAQLSLRVGGNLLTSSQNPVDQPYNSAGSTTSGKLGYQAGLLYVGQLSQRVALVPELQFRREYAHALAHDYSLIDFYRDWDYRLSQSYLSIPLLVRVSLGPVYVEAGPQASLLLQAREVGTVTVNGWGRYTQDFDQAVTSDYRRFDIGPCLGVGVKLPAGLGVSLRAYQGLVHPGREVATQPTFLSVMTPYRGDTPRRQSVEASLTYQLLARR